MNMYQRTLAGGLLFVMLVSPLAAQTGPRHAQSVATWSSWLLSVGGCSARDAHMKGCMGLPLGGVWYLDLGYDLHALHHRQGQVLRVGGLTVKWSF